jgi:hypothetical protein
MSPCTYRDEFSSFQNNNTSLDDEHVYVVGATSTAFKQAYEECTLNLKALISVVLTGFQCTTGPCVLRSD